ncbi:MAG TPA: hypothetical protein VG892_05345 [Terriglobales bacterium]|jgi:hypothetical protein|nr:hypothetical protein [Terriglobales bacterium]
MAKKKKAKPFSATKAVKSMARAALGSPAPTKLLPDKREDESAKHKPTLGRMLSDSE